MHKGGQVLCIYIKELCIIAACSFGSRKLFIFCRSDHELELDLFLLQLCAAFAPADLYVRRILERFQLSNYLALDLKRSSEYVISSSFIEIIVILSPTSCEM